VLSTSGLPIAAQHDGLFVHYAQPALLLWLLLCPRYNALFQFLLRLKRVQMHLEQAWQQLGRCAGVGDGC
jgi:hypothetical protein